MIFLTSPTNWKLHIWQSALVYFSNLNIVKCSDEDTNDHDILRSALVNGDDHVDDDKVGDDDDSDDDKGDDDDEFHLPKTKRRVVAEPLHHWSESAV